MNTPSHISTPPMYYYQNPMFASQADLEQQQEVPYQIHYVNMLPYVCYNCQPEILHPIYFPQLPKQNERLLPEIATTFVNEVKPYLENLENDAKKFEQQAIENVVKTSCFGFCKK